MKKVYFIFIALIFLLSCSQSKKEEIKIGAILPLTGDMAQYGESLKKGMDLAIENINKQGGINNLLLKVIYEDGQGISKTSVNAFNKIISAEKVPLVIGCMFSAPTLSITPIAEKEKIVLLSPTASSIELTSSGDYIFRIYPSDTYDGFFLANYTYHNLNIRKVSIIYERVSSITAVSEIFKYNFENYGGEIVSFEGYNSETNNFRSILKKISDDNPELIFFPGNLNNMVKILIQSKELNINKKFLTISTFYDNKVLELAGNAAENVMFSSPMFDITDTSEQIRIFKKLYLEKYNKEPDILGGYGFDVINISSMAIKNNGIKPENIKQGLYSIKNFPGVTGKTSFDKNGDVIKELRILKVSNGNFVPVQ